MRLAINCTALLSPLTGIGQYTFALASELLQDPELELSFFYVAGWDAKLRNKPLPGMGAAKNWVKRLVPRPYVLSRWLQQARFSQGVRRLHPHIYHEPNFLPFRFDGPTVVTAHDLSFVRYPQTHPIERLRAMDTYFPRAIESAACLITDSAFVRDELIEVYGVRPERIAPILLGVSDEFRPRGELECGEALARHGLRYRGYVLSVGTLEPRKNIASVVRAFSLLPSTFRKRFPLVLVGMKGWHTHQIEQVVAPMLSSGEIIVPGYVDRHALTVLMSAAGAFVYPSLYEGFGLPALESMASGVPPIVSNVSSLPEVVGETGVYVDPTDVDALAQAMRMIIEDDATRTKLARLAIERAANFTWARCARETRDVYRRVMQAG